MKTSLDPDAITYVLNDYEMDIYRLPNLPKDVTYSWKVISKDSNGKTSEGPWWNFELTDTTGAYYSNNYINLFEEYGDALTVEELKAKWEAIFVDNKNQANRSIYIELPPNMGRIVKKEGDNQYVISEGMSYGMMIAVQMDAIYNNDPRPKDVFDRLWRWADSYMRHKDGPRKGYFRWKCDPFDGCAVIEDGWKNPASDGEEYFAMALFFASGRWGNNKGINYRLEADKILEAMFDKETEEGVQVEDAVYNMFNKKEKQVVFTPRRYFIFFY